MKLKIGAAVLLLLVLAGVGWWLFGGERARPGRHRLDQLPLAGAERQDRRRRLRRPEDRRRRLPHQPSGAGRRQGALGTAEESSEVAIACRQIGPIVFKEPIRDGERVFDERRSLIFKSLQVVRFFDAQAQRAGLRRLFRPGDDRFAAKLDLDGAAGALGHHRREDDVREGGRGAERYPIYETD